MAKSLKKSIEPPQNGAFEADQVELRAMREGSSSTASCALDEIMSGETLDYADEVEIKVPDWEQSQVGAEALTGTANEVISLRKQALGDRYPFEIDRSSLKYKPSADLMYEFCLATCHAAKEKQVIGGQSLVRHFERLAKDLLREFIGGDAEAVRFGWPSEADWDDAPTRTDRKIKWLKKTLRFDDDEWTIDRSGKLDTMRNYAKDARIDIIIRRSHEDDRPGGLTLLGQCGCGKNDVDQSSHKHEELSRDWLTHFFGRTSVPPPIFAFATTQHVVRVSDLYLKQSSGKTMIFDRIRLMILAAKHPQVLVTHLNQIKVLLKQLISLD